MAKLILTPENQIKRLNIILNRIELLQELPLEQLVSAPEKSWNVLEVLEHLSVAYSFYDTKIEKALDKTTSSNSDAWTFKARMWQQFVIEGQRPKNGKRPFKLKTLKRFEPLLNEDEFTNEKAKAIFERFFVSYLDLKTSIVESRHKFMKHKTFTSAIGAIVNFYLPEAFEFLICHAERHLVQIDKILASQS